eukprot:PhF_6_TR10439/c0_g1_i1/m.16506/K03362/FBXW1_11, BTRC, beta-TRCP; F-box and WD-40 domain protein 1/11
MAHYLSDVTHFKLDHRREMGVVTYGKGLRVLGEFPSYLRAASTVCRGNGIPTMSSKEEEVWCGDQDGVLSVRKGAFGNMSYVIEGKHKVYVYCITVVDPHVWVGLSDGCVRVFERTTMEMVRELKAHAGSVMCMCTSGGFSKEKYVFTGSRDWMVIKWDCRTIKPVQRLSGHQNAVRCIVGDECGDYFFSAGDDYVIRCWETTPAGVFEKAAPWPLIGHENSVVALCLVDPLLFSASTDGSLRAWNVQGGIQIRILEQRDSAITSIMYDPAVEAIWVGGVDGIISQWKVSTLSQLRRLADHTGSFVVGLSLVSRRVQTHLYCVMGTGNIRVLATDANDPLFDTLTIDDSLYDRMEELRYRILDNFSELDELRQRLGYQGRVEGYRKDTLISVLGKLFNRDIKSRYFSRLLEYFERIRDRRKKYRIAAAALLHNNVRLLHRYFRKWLIIGAELAVIR